MPRPRRRVLRVAETRQAEEAHENRHAESGEPFAFAGLWETWRDPQGDVIPSCTIITTSANDTLSPIHDRMPVILPRDLEDLWLDDTVTDPDTLTSVLTPYDDEALEAYEVSTRWSTQRGMMGRR